MTREDEDTVPGILSRHFDEHLKSSGRRLLPIDARVAQIYDDINEFELKAKVDNVELSDDEEERAGTVDNVNDLIAQTLIHFFDCSFATEVSSDTKESIQAIQELAGAVAAQRAEVARSVLDDRLEGLTVVLLERIRSSACRCVGWIVQYLFANDKMTNKDLEGLLDTASQALVPRFTDKAQSVRQAAIEAARFFFCGKAQGEMDDPDIRQSLQWSLQHDPSVTNRVAALESLPVTLQTMDVILTRVRDVKAKVRVAAVKALKESVPDIDKWEAEQCAELIETGWTDRCLMTKVEVERMVFSWLKATKFDMMRFLCRLNVVDFEESCQKVISILLNATDAFLAEELADTELIAFRQGIKQATGKLALVNQALEVEQVFLLQARCLQAEKLDPRQKEIVLSEILPDIPEICQLFELHASALMQAIAEEKGFEVINRLVFVCLHLLSLVKSAEIEEGSRLHLTTTLQGMLESIVMPDDLIEGSIETLHRIHRVESEFWETALGAVESLSSQSDDDGLSDNRLIRILSILCIVFEKSSSRLASSHIAESFSHHIVPTISHENALVREVAVSCFGKLGLFTKEEAVMSDLKPNLLEIASDDTEKLSIRAQAILGLSDWSLLFAGMLSSTNDETPSVEATISEIMSHPELSLACVAAEAACKLLLNGKASQVSWLAQLLVFFFDPRIAQEEEDDEESKEVGSPVRLQQILTQFFPLYCLRSHLGRSRLVGSVATALEMVTSKHNGTKKRGTKAFPVTKMVDFVLATTVEAEGTLAEAAKKEGKEMKAEGSSLPLRVSIQICTFLACNNENLGVTILRALCKILGATELDLEREALDDLKGLVELVEDLENMITDKTCLDQLNSFSEVLDEVDFSAKSAHLDQDEEMSLASAVERVHISPSRGALDKENATRETPGVADKRDSTGTFTSRPTRLSISSTN